MVRQATQKIYSMLDDGLITEAEVVQMCLNWLSEVEVQEMCLDNCVFEEDDL